MSTELHLLITILLHKVICCYIYLFVCIQNITQFNIHSKEIVSSITIYVRNAVTTTRTKATATRKVAATTPVARAHILASTKVSLKLEANTNAKYLVVIVIVDRDTHLIYIGR